MSSVDVIWCGTGIGIAAIIVLIKRRPISAPAFGLRCILVTLSNCSDRSPFVQFLLRLLLLTKNKIVPPVLPIIGEPNWYYLCLLSPYAGVYYWRSGDRVDEFSIKLEANDEETENEISVLGSEEEMERMWRALEWQEKGMVKVPGLLD